MSVCGEVEFLSENFFVDLGQAAAHVVGFDAVAEAGPGGGEFVENGSDLAGL